MAASNTLLTLCNRVRATSNNFDLSDDQITEWVRYAEERFNNELRDVSMKVTATAAADGYIIDIPPDWLETIWLKFVPTPTVVLNPQGVNSLDLQRGKNLRPCTPDEFNDVTNDIDNPDYRTPLFMHHGVKIYLNPRLPALNSQKYEMGYYQMVPPLQSTSNRLWNRASNLYLTATLAYGAMYDVEDDRAATWDAVTRSTIDTLNAYTTRVQMGGGPMKKRIRTFG